MKTNNNNKVLHLSLTDNQVSALLFYYHTNHIGSIEKISNTYGNVTDSMSYTPFGSRRLYSDWSKTDTAKHLIDRGFTGQQHLDNFALINFNGRMYDPVLAHFLSPDPYIQAPENPLNYNRYAYCLFSPLQYVDPTGEIYRKFEDYENGTFLGEIDDGVDETIRVTKKDYELIKNRYDYDISKGNTDLPLYNRYLERNSIGKKGYDIAQTALSYKGSTQWAYSVKKDDFAAGKHKCNKFIYDVLSESGVTAFYSNRVPLAGEWADPKIIISGWDVIIESPHVGDIIAGGHSFEDASGHVAIVTHVFESGYIETISASRTNVRTENFGNSVLKNKGKWGNITYKPITIRRFKD